MPDRRLLVLVCLAVALAVPAAAQPEAPETASEAVLVERLGSTYEVLRLRDGYALRPRAERSFAVVDLGPDGVAVDGEPVDDRELREALGEDADAEAVLALARRVGRGRDPGGLAEEERALAELEREMARKIEEQVEEIERRRRERLEEIEERIERERDVVHRRRERNDTRVSFGSSLTIEEHESVRDVVVILGSLEVRGEVRGDAVAIGGPVYVDGEVGGAVTSVGGAVSLGSRADVDGDVVSVGDAVHRESGARVRGEITEVAVAPIFLDLDGPWNGGWWDGRDDWSLVPFFAAPWGGPARRLGNTAVLAALVLLVVALARRRSEAVARRVDLEPWKAALAGLFTQVLAVPLVFAVFLILVISIIGLPLAVVWLPLAIAALALAFLVGYAAVALLAGRKVESRLGRPSDLGPYLAALLGVLVIQGLTLLGGSIEWLGGPVGLLALLLLVCGFVVKYAAWTVGLGAFVLEVTGGRRGTVPALAAAPPSVPPPPTSAAWETPPPPAEEPPPPPEEPPGGDAPADRQRPPS